MFDIGDYIVCGSNGVCRVKEIGPLSMNGADRTRKYYTLEQIYSGGGRIFTPVDNQKVIAKNLFELSRHYTNVRRLVLQQARR